MKRIILLCITITICIGAAAQVWTTIGTTKYDLQTNNSISSRLIWNNDGSISACWNYSPDISTGYPYRGTGYNYWDGSAWTFTCPPCPTTRTEAARTGFTNIVVTPSGKEMTIAHQAIANTTFSRLYVNWRAQKGQGAWSFTYPWGQSGGFDTWAKACGGLTNESVYVIWDASGAPASSISPPNLINGQNGAIGFGRSLDGGQTWDSVRYIPEIDSNFYLGFDGDSYSIDARGDTVAIAVGDEFTDIVLLKSFDAGLHWSKTIVMKFPIPFYSKQNLNAGTFYIGNDTICDTVFSNAGDPKVIIDNDGICHVFFSAFNFHFDTLAAVGYSPHNNTDHLYYWNENMGPDTTTVWNPNGGNGPFIAIAAAEDFSGNGIIDTPIDTCIAPVSEDPWGNYGGGITGMPSCGIDENGSIYVSYQTINELADTTITQQCHRHMYIMMLPKPYNPADWTHPYNIVQLISQGGNGENEECVFGCMARRVSWADKTAYVLYQVDSFPGLSTGPAGTCAQIFNDNVNNKLVLAKIDLNNIIAGINEVGSNDILVGQNNPNPAAGLTSINIALKKSANLKIEITNVIGKVVYRESKGKVTSGSYTFTINTGNMSKGVYTYTVSAGDVKTTRKMIVQ